MNNWPSFLPPPLFVDFETVTEAKYDVRKSVTSIHYFKDERFFAQGMAYADVATKTNAVVWHDEGLDEAIDKLPTDRTLICHNALFDAKLLSLLYDKRFEVYACTQAMGRIALRNYTRGFSLAALYHYLFGEQLAKSAVEELRGYREVPAEMRAMFGRYVMNDVAAMVRVLLALLPLMPDSQWWHMDWAQRQFSVPALRIRTGACEQFLNEYQLESERVYAEFGATEKEFASSAKFVRLLLEHTQLPDPLVMGREYFASKRWMNKPHIPVKMGGGKNPTWKHDLSKSSEGFITQILDSDNETVARLGQLRLRAASSSEPAQARKLIQVSEVTGGVFALGVHTSGTASHRLAGTGDACGINVLAIKRGSTLRRALAAPKGYRMLSLDMSAFELGICRFLAQDQPAMDALLDRNRDLYVEFARVAFKNPDIAKATHPEERQVGKTSELQLQYNSGALTLRRQLLAQGVLITLHEAEQFVHTFRKVAHPALYRYWQTFGTYLPRMRSKGTNIPVKNAPFLTIEYEGIRLPNGLKLNFPDLRQVRGEWTHQKTLGQSLVREKTYGGKLMQYCCQSLANVIIQEKKRTIARELGIRCVHEVYDDLSMIVPEREIDDAIAPVTEIAVRALDWWPELPLSCEWGVGDTWGDCDKSNNVYGKQIT